MELTEQYGRVTKMMGQYYSDAPEPTLEGWEEWIENLDEPMKSEFKEKGFEVSKNALPFIRFFAELKDYGMRDYMREVLNEDDFAYYKKVIEPA